MMIYCTSYYYMPRYEWTNCNQHGDRFKRIGEKRINTVRLICKRICAADLEDLVVLSHTLAVPVHYDFDDNTAYIEIMSSEAVKEKT